MISFLSDFYGENNLCGCSVAITSNDANDEKIIRKLAVDCVKMSCIYDCKKRQSNFKLKFHTKTQKEAFIESVNNCTELQIIEDFRKLKNGLKISG